MPAKVKLTVTESRCRSGFHKAGEEFIVYPERTVCPPVCMELWHCAYPYVWALLNGAELDSGDSRSASCVIRCPDGGRVVLRAEAVS